MSALHPDVAFLPTMIDLTERSGGQGGDGRNRGARSIAVGAVVGFVATATVLALGFGTDALPIVGRSPSATPAASNSSAGNSVATPANAATLRPEVLPPGYERVAEPHSALVSGSTGAVEVLSRHDAAGALTGVVTAAHGSLASVLRSDIHPVTDPSVATVDLGGVAASVARNSAVWSGVTILGWADVTGTSHVVTGWGVGADEVIKLATSVAAGGSIPTVEGFTPTFSGELGAGPLGYAAAGSTVTDSVWGAPGDAGRAVRLIETDGQLPIDVYAALTPSAPAPGGGPPSAIVSSRPNVLQGKPGVVEMVLWQAGDRTLALLTRGSRADEALSMASAVR
jgi:hypothetical protein